MRDRQEGMEDVEDTNERSWMLTSVDCGGGGLDSRDIGSKGT